MRTASRKTRQARPLLQDALLAAAHLKLALEHLVGRRCYGSDVLERLGLCARLAAKKSGQPVRPGHEGDRKGRHGGQRAGERIEVGKEVRAENQRARDPEIEFSADGRTAVMRFRKDYIIEDGRSNRNGAVLQELRWRQTESGWKIVSERDLRVL